MADVSKRPVGRPQGVPTPIINLRIPLDLLERLDRYVDYEEQRRRESVNRTLVMREALTAWLQDKNFHIPSDLVVDQWSSEGESSLILDFLFLHGVWTTFDRLISDKITPAISTPCDFTTKSGGI